VPKSRLPCWFDTKHPSLFAAFNVADGTVISALHRRHGAAEFKKFLARIDAAVPADLDVHLICDNYGTHKTPTITAWLDKHPRFHMHFTPTSSSWMNQVERWFGFLTDQMIRRGTHKSVQALEADIRSWVATWNDNPGRSCGRRPQKRSSSRSDDLFNGSQAQDTSDHLSNP
jgi:hypothetical protein